MPTVLVHATNELVTPGNSGRLGIRSSCNIALLNGDEKVQWSQAAGAFSVQLRITMPNDKAVVFKISL